MGLLTSNSGNSRFDLLSSCEKGCISTLDRAIESRPQLYSRGHDLLFDPAAA